MEKLIQYCTKDSLYDGTYNEGYWHAPGMGYLIVTENGKLVAIDGGQPNDAEDFVALLEKEAKGKKPEIDMWIITHAHGDHYGCLQNISRNEELANRITVKKFVYWFPEEFGANGVTSGEILHGNRSMDEICKTMRGEAYRPKRDEKIVIDGMEFHFLYIPDDCSILNTKSWNVNYCSLIFTVQGKNKKAMITGDAFDRPLSIVAWRYDKALKCDIMQMPHHGFCDAHCEEFYRYVDAQTILVPISKGGWRDMRSERWYRSRGGTINLTAIARADKVYLAFEGNVELEL